MLPLRIATCLLTSGLLLFFAGGANAVPTAATVEQQAEQTVKAHRQSQKIVNAWSLQRGQLADQAEQLEKELKLLVRQRQKAETYLAGQEAKVAELARRLAEIDRIREGLEPLLDKTLVRLEEFVANDLPFLAGERAQRLASLKDVLDDYDSNLSLKTRRLLEALGIEARYGTRVAVSEAELELDGGTRRVRLLRLGRLGLFALDNQGSRAWRYDPAAKKFVAIQGHIRELALAAEIAQRRRVVSLVELPVGKAPAPEARP